MGILQDFLNGKPGSELSNEEVVSLLSNYPQGEISKVTGVDLYEDFINIFLDKGDPIILFVINNVPWGLKCWPEVGDELIFIKNGMTLPIFYNKTANSYLVSESGDEELTKIFSFMGKLMDMTRFRQLLEARYESDEVIRLMKVYGEYFARLKTMTLTKSLLMLGKIVGFTFDFGKDRLAQKKFFKKFNFEGTIVSHKLFKDKFKERDTYFILIRIYSEVMNTVISCLYIESPVRKIELPPQNAHVKLTGKIHTVEKYYKIETLYFGKHLILS